MDQINPRFPSGKAKALTLSYDDGVEQDIRLIQILNQHGLKATFNLNTGCYTEDRTVFPAGQVHRRLSANRAIALYKDSGHEVAVHSRTHPFLEKLPVPLTMRELLLDREMLEKQFHTIVRGMAYPYGTYNDDVIDCAKKAGLVYGRTVENSGNFDLPQDWLRLKPTVHHSASNLMELAERFVEAKPGGAPRLFYLWGHSYEFEQNNNWDVIEKFAAYMSNRSDIWYATNIEIYDYMQMYHRLEFSADGSLVYNPSNMPVWFVVNEQEYCVEPGCITHCVVQP